MRRTSTASFKQNMKNVTALFLGLLALGNFAILTEAEAAVAQSINYQGQVLDAAGNPMPTGDYDFEISLFPVESGGAALWGPQRFNGQSGPGLSQKVPVVGGRFNLVLGPKDTAGKDLGAVFSSNPSVFLELKVGTGNPIAPRQQMLSAPYAFQALTSAGLKGDQILVDGRLGIGTIPTNGIPLEVNGAVLFRGTGSGGPISFGSPNTETGLTMGIVNRADIRFDDSTLKIIAMAGRLPRGPEQGIAIATSGNVGIGIGNPGYKLHVMGAIRASGTINSDSDVNAKADFAPVDSADILARVVKLPIQQWRFKAENPDVKHMGPMAQDFRAAFGLGDASTAIATVDADGVALAAIQALNQIVSEKDAEIRELRQSMAALKAQVDRLAQQQSITLETDQR